MTFFSYKLFLFYKSLFFFYTSSLSLINMRISKMKFEIRDIQSRTKRVKIENLKMIMFF